jgi:hypothetical protein
MFAFSDVEYGVVMTPSIVVEPNWLSTLVKTMNSGDVSVVEPYSNACLNHERGIHPEPVDTVKPFCTAFKRPVWEHLAGFNEGLSESGPVMQDFGDRALKAGFRLFCDPSIYVHHFFRNGYRPSPEAISRDMAILKGPKVAA